MGTGQCNVKAYNRQLCELIHHDIAKPSMIISHELSLDKAPDAYKHFDHRDKGWMDEGGFTSGSDVNRVRVSQRRQATRAVVAMVDALALLMSLWFMGPLFIRRKNRRQDARAMPSAENEFGYCASAASFCLI
jgi:hypothetical protein